jgi:ubiquinone/menaquinone biosynthesis C-methylase UbiE
MASAAATFSGPQYYDEYLGPAWFEAHAAELARRLPSDPPGDVLEIACGTGLLTRHARERLDPARRLVASDFSAPMLAYAREKFRDRKDIEWHEADASRLPFADAAFGAVICGFGVMFFPDRVAGLREARRVLTEEGLLLFNVWDRIEHHLPAAVNAKVMHSLIPKEAPGFEVPFQMHDAGGLRNLLKATGFDEVRIETKRFPIKDADPREIAIGQVRGTHRSALIEKAGVPLESAIDKVAHALADAGGNPYNGYTTALYVEARAFRR